MITEHNFGTGGILSPLDERDFHWNNLGGSTAPAFNWELGYDIESKLPSRMSLKNQGQSSSCGGQATAYYGEVLEAIATKTQEERSAKFIYAQTHIGAGGSFMRDNFDIAVKQGWAKEAVLSSYLLDGALPDEAFMTDASGITQTVIDDASMSRAYSYANVDLNIDAVAQALANNYGAEFLIQGSNNGTWLSPNPKAPVAGDTTWNHFLYVGKALLIDGKKYLVCRNSWGEVGTLGWQMIGEDFFNGGHILECRTLVYKNKPLQFQFTKNLNIGMRNGDVLQLQNRLVKEGYATFVPTGYFGALTGIAIMKYQVAKGVKYPAPTCGPLTRVALNVVK